MAIELKLLGPPRLIHAQVETQPLASKALALVAYLALERGPHPREQLASLLWGESPDEAARTSLRQALKQLRHLLGDTVIITRATVELTPAVTCDVRQFLEAASRSPRRALRTRSRSLGSRTPSAVWYERTDFARPAPVILQS